MTIFVEPKGEGSGTDRADQLVATIKNTIGITTRVIVQPPGTIERSAGKAKHVIDKRPR
jgi:phenylacetate-CoA ligase